MGGRSSVTKQHNILMAPFLAQDTREADPSGPTDVIGVCHQGVVAQVLFENIFTDCNAPLLRHVAKAPRIKRFLGAFYNECRRIFIKLIGVNPDPTVFGFLKDKGERVLERLLGAEPDKLTQPFIHCRFERILIQHPSLRIQPVTCHHNIVFDAVTIGAVHLGLISQIDA